MVDVGLAVGTRLAASPARARVARENNAPNGAPSLDISLGRRKGHAILLWNPRLARVSGPRIVIQQDTSTEAPDPALLPRILQMTASIVLGGESVVVTLAGDFAPLLGRSVLANHGILVAAMAAGRSKVTSSISAEPATLLIRLSSDDATTGTAIERGLQRIGTMQVLMPAAAVEHLQAVRHRASHDC